MSLFGFHYRLERKTMGLVLAIIVVASIGGLVEIAPLFTIHQTVEDASERWCAWTNDPLAAMMLNTRRQALDLEQLRRYIAGFDQIDRIMVGLFDRKTGLHFGIIIGEFIDEYVFPGGELTRGDAAGTRHDVAPRRQCQGQDRSFHHQRRWRADTGIRAAAAR